MLAILYAGGWLMLPLLLSSVLALAIVLERLWALRTSHAVPQALQRLQAAGKSKEAIQAAGAHEVHRLEKYLSPLGTIASITPLLGLLGTVVGMIDVFQQLDLAAGNA
ncbi:MAG: MotA/TolQ/ExbB proton channel family protein, partial [Pseudomonadaceae bacterium]|nr:MotA/TolQ/ExbB proton channel family protein [Pseudomonadaceae bacterium]